MPLEYNSIFSEYGDTSVENHFVSYTSAYAVLQLWAA